MNKEFLHMQKLAGLITESEYKQKLEEKTLSPEEQKVLDDITSTLNEGMFDDVIEKVKSYAKKGLLTTAILTSLMALPNFSNAQQQQIKQAAQIEMSAPNDVKDLVKNGGYELGIKLINTYKSNPNSAKEWNKKHKHTALRYNIESTIRTSNMLKGIGNQSEKDIASLGDLYKNSPEALSFLQTVK